MLSFDKNTTARAVGATMGATAFVACCMQFIAPHEGISYKAYADGGGVWTICRGHTENVHKGDTAAEEQCQRWFQEDTDKASASVTALTGNAKIPPISKKVFVDFVFNVGKSNFAKSSMLKKIKAGDIAAACREFSRWKYVAGKDCTVRANGCYGIAARRAEQQAECLRGVK